MNSRYFYIVLTVLVLLAFLVSVGGAAAQYPQPYKSNIQPGSGSNQPDPPIFPTTNLTYQGRLTTSSGTAVNSLVSMVFKI